MQKCPKCQSTEIRKDGIVKQKQRHKCKICNYHFTVQQIGKPYSKRREALILYLAGLNLRKTGDLLNTSHVTIYNWLKGLKANIKQINETKLQPMQMKSVLKHLEQEHNAGNTKGLLLIGFLDETTNIMLVMEDK